MVLLIKNKHASLEDVAHVSVSPAADTPHGRLAKLRMQNPRNAGVPKARSLVCIVELYRTSPPDEPAHYSPISTAWKKGGRSKRIVQPC